MVRFKNRYLLVQLEFFDDQTGKCNNVKVNANFTALELQKYIFQSIQLNFGDHGLAVFADQLRIKYYSPITNLAIISTPRSHHKICWAALTFITRLKDSSCYIRVLHCGGTIKKVQQITIKRDRALISELGKSMKNDAILAKRLRQIIPIGQEEDALQRAVDENSKQLKYIMFPPVLRMGE